MLPQPESWGISYGEEAHVHIIDNVCIWPFLKRVISCCVPVRMGSLKGTILHAKRELLACTTFESTHPGHQSWRPGSSRQKPSISSIEARKRNRQLLIGHPLTWQYLCQKPEARKPFRLILSLYKKYLMK